jgi:ABC-type branched-subunit amino acid transport system ATPase component
MVGAPPARAFQGGDKVMALNFGEKITEGEALDVIEDKRVREAYLGSEGV